VVTPTGRREVVGWLGEHHRVSERRACGLVGVGRSTCRYMSRRPRATALQARLLQWAAERPRFGYRRLYVLLRREGWAVNHKRVYRLYRAAGLAVPRRKRKRIAVSQRLQLAVPRRPNERWSMDFMLDTLADGRTFRVLNVVDDFTRECVAIDVARSIPGPRVVRVLERLRAQRGLPAAIVLDNGSEFAGRVLDTWAYAAGVQLQFIRPGKPVENAFIESFNGKFRDECLNEHWFLNLAHAMSTIDAWRVDYNTVRPHSSLGNRTPDQFARFSVGARRLRPPRTNEGSFTEASVT
jgi:putative transposase